MTATSRILRAAAGGVRPVLRVGGVPEHFNAPFHLAKARGLYEKAGFDMQWTMYPGGTGAMATALEAGEIDVALMLSEGSVAKIAAGSPLRLCGTYVGSPLTWGVHVKKGSSRRSIDDLRGRVFGVSRPGSGSHLMAAVMGHQKGWDVAKDVPMKTVGTLDGARKAMGNDEIEAFMWEEFTTKHLVDDGEWEKVGRVPTPWPCFMFVASNAALGELSNEIQKLITVTHSVCTEFKANANDETVRYVRDNHRVSLDDARLWLSGVSWACASEVAPSVLKDIAEALTNVNLVPEGWKLSADTLIAPGVCSLREAQEMPEGMYGWRVAALKNWIAEHQKQNNGASPTMKDLAGAGHLDQYHYTGLAANDELIELLELQSSDKVLDVGSGIGGPARYISWKSGCTVHGLELQEDLVGMANEVSQIVGLADKVSCKIGDASEMTEKEVYDAFYSQLVILHIPEAPRMRMFERLFQALKPDGRFLIEDMVCVSSSGAFKPEDDRNLREVVGAAFVPNCDSYRAALERAGFVDLKFEDQSALWASFAQERYTKYVAKKETEIATHGQALYDQRVIFYKVVADLFATGDLGGVCITGRRPSPGEALLSKTRAISASRKRGASESGDVVEMKRSRTATAESGQPPWACGSHDALQYHFYSEGIFVSVRLFRTESLRRAWAWAAVRDASGVWKKEQLFSAEPLAEWVTESDRLKVAVGGIQVHDGPTGGEIAVSNLRIKFTEGTVLRWDVPGQTQGVIHRPALPVTIEWPERLNAPVQGQGYSKRYYGDYPRYWAYGFFQGFPGDTPMWTADAYFGDSKYNYFKVLDRNAGTAKAGEKCYHHEMVAFAEMDGKSCSIKATPLVEPERTIIRSAAMESEMYECLCELEYSDGTTTTRGLGLRERCKGTLA